MNRLLRPVYRSYSSVSSEEVLKFSRAAKHWWDQNGEFAMLHSMNPIRVQYIREMMRPFDHSAKPLVGLTCLDIGCGGGLLSESLARLGAKVTAIDASEENISVACTHLRNSLDKSLAIDYQCTTAEDLVANAKQYDLVVSLEVLEHVENQEEFVSNVCKLAKSDGHLFLSTINRTISSYFGTVLIAENLLGVPRGTHDHNKYVKPEELCLWIESSGGSVQDISGLGLNPFNKSWFLMKPTSLFCRQELSMNYILYAKNKEI